MLTYYEIKEKANEKDLNHLLWTIEDLLLQGEKDRLQANDESTRKAKTRMEQTLTEWVNRLLEGEDKIHLTPEDFRHLRPSYIFTQAFASLLKD